MELRHLRYFLAVAEDLNFSRAAQRLHVSQPPLSRQIRALEAELGLELFKREKNRVRLTEAGRVLAVEAARLLRASEDLLGKARRLAEAAKHRLHIGYIANVHGPLVIEAASRFREAHPEAVVKVFDYTIAKQIDAILSGQIDVGFIGFREAAAGKGLRVESIGTTYAVLALPRNHPLAGRRRLSLKEVKGEPFIGISELAFPGARRYVLQCCALAGFQPNVAHEALQPIDLLNGVAVGEGIALVPEQMRHLPHRGVAFAELTEPAPRAESYVAWNENRSSPVLLEFVAVAKRTYAELARGGGQSRRRSSR